DGQYVYFVGTTGATPQHIVRYDTHAVFTDMMSWKSVRPLDIDTRATELGYAAFDGRHLYFGSAVNGFVLQYDRQLPFTSASTSWTLFDLATLDSAAIGVG